MCPGIYWRSAGAAGLENPGVVDDPLGFAFVDDKKRLGLDLCEVRMIIEPEIAALAAERAVPEEIEELQRIQDEVKELCDKEEPHMHKDIEFHEMLAKMSKNLIMPNIIPVIQSGISLFINITDYSLTKETVRTHQMIVDAIRERDPKAAKAAMIEHLASNQEKIFRRVRRCRTRHRCPCCEICIKPKG